jgi:hypothetical protein
MKKLLLCSLILLAGCMPARTVRYDSLARPATMTDQIQVVDSTSCKQPYKTIGQVEWDGGLYSSGESALIELKPKAAEMGGNALMDLKNENRQSGQNSWILWSAKVIVFDK